MKQTDVIRRAIVTEKTTLLREGDQILAFEVALDAVSYTHLTLPTICSV